MFGTFGRFGRPRLVLVVALALLPSLAGAQDLGIEDDPFLLESEATRRFRALTNPEEDAEEGATSQRAPFEFYRTQVAPFDVLTYVKQNQWVMLTQEIQANLGDYEGQLRTGPVGLANMPRSVVFRRDARLIKGQPMRLNWPAFFARESKFLDLELIRSGMLRPDESTQAVLLAMPTHQMLAVVMAENPSAYDHWRRYQAVIPATTDLGDMQEVERRTYYRLVVPQEPSETNVPSHPLTWAAISHVIWDDFDPSDLNHGQRQALIDWLHWGGQLIINGGAASSLATLADVESFLSPYLPGEPSGEHLTLSEEDLEPLARSYPPPAWKYEELAEAWIAFGAPSQEPGPPLIERVRSRYKAVDRMNLPPDRSLLVIGLTPLTADAVWITDGQGRRLGLERRVGRGRLLMLGIDLKDAAFRGWKGCDTFVRRVVFRRPEDRWVPHDPYHEFMLSGPQLSWYRLLGRDLNPAPTVPPLASSEPPFSPLPSPSIDIRVLPDSGPESSESVAAWLDSARIPSLAREALIKASGIEVPGAPFVLRVILAYLIALVPLNWLFCRMVLRRQEMAWVIVPLLAFGFAFAVERAAVIDSGYDRACDEIDLLELQADYPRGHLNRFSVLSSTGRENFSITFPGEPSALALPMNANLSIRGEQSTQSTWESTQGPSLLDFRVEPRSLAMVRAEQMVNLRGEISLRELPDGSKALVNQSELELRDAILVEVGAQETEGGELDDLPSSGGNLYLPIGTISPGAVVSLAESGLSSPDYPGLVAARSADRPDWADLGEFFLPLCSYNWGRPEDSGEVRLVAWTDGPMPGQVLDPAVDRHRGFTLVVAHLRYGPPPSPDRPIYSSYRPDQDGASPPAPFPSESNRR